MVISTVADVYPQIELSRLAFENLGRPDSVLRNCIRVLCGTLECIPP